MPSFVEILKHSKLELDENDTFRLQSSSSGQTDSSRVRGHASYLIRWVGAAAGGTARLQMHTPDKESDGQTVKGRAS